MKRTYLFLALTAALSVAGATRPAVAAGTDGAFNFRAGWFFPSGDSEFWQINADIRAMVQHKQLNLLQDFSHLGTFDVIFCRNVLIYFDDASRRIAAENLYENLAPGGYICLGHSESMSRITPLFDVRRFADAIVYQRPVEGTYE